MLYQILKRLVSFLATILVAMALIFFVLEVLPGNPALVMLGPDATVEQIETLSRELGLDRPAPVRFAAWVLEMARGDLGVSYAYGVPVAALLWDRLSVTVPLALFAICLTVLMALALGIYAATNNNRLRGQVVMGFTQIGIAIPNFWFGLLLALFFAVTLRWFPTTGFPGWGNGIGPALHALVLPAVALAVVQGAILARVTRASLLEVLHDDFTRTALAKGLSRRQMIWRHALQNALIPIATIMGLQFANLMTGTIVIESVFSLPGVGRLLFQAVAQRDLTVVRSVAVVMAALVITMNFLVDLAYLAIDPRLRAQK